MTGVVDHMAVVRMRIDHMGIQRFTRFMIMSTITNCLNLLEYNYIFRQLVFVSLYSWQHSCINTYTKWKVYNFCNYEFIIIYNSKYMILFRKINFFNTFHSSVIFTNNNIYIFFQVQLYIIMIVIKVFL